MAGGVGSTERVMKATIEAWARKISEITERNLLLVALMKKKGLIQYGCDSAQHRWIVRKAEHELQPFPDGVPVSFDRVNTKENAYLPNRGYFVSDTITLREKLEQGGPSAMVKIFQDREATMRRGAMRRLAAEMYVDGNAAAQVAREAFHGLDSMMGVGAQVDTSIVASVHDDTYAGLSTAVGGLSSDPLFDRIWTPTIINTNYNPGSGTRNWNQFADEYVREMIIRLTFGQADEDRPDIGILTRDSYRDLLNILATKERIQVTRGSSEALVKMGFTNTVEVDGVPMTWDSSVPTTDSDTTAYATVVRGYMLTTAMMALRLLGSEKQLFKSKVTFNDSYQADNIFLWCLGNLKFETPKNFGKFVDLSGVDA